MENSNEEEKNYYFHGFTTLSVERWNINENACKDLLVAVKNHLLTDWK
jgi:hypothetical protein